MRYPRGKISLRRTKIKWEDPIKKDTESLGDSPNWKEKARDKKE